MKDRLPVYIENRELPINEEKIDRNNNSYGYVSILFLSSMIITVASVMTVIFLGK